MYFSTQDQLNENIYRISELPPHISGDQGAASRAIGRRPRRQPKPVSPEDGDDD